ncbi:MAG: class II aldolase/adducin family protein [Nitriliruptorales bacterium]|nr:class II aldolase/adducin family protein [Nitriliruptorales bacterium]
METQVERPLPHPSEELAGNAVGPPLPELSPAAEVALLARTLFREGYDDHLAGHITSRQPDGTYLVNPYGLTWDEITAADVMRIDANGVTIEGKWTVSPAVTLHLAVHEVRDDVGVVVHNHPVYGTLWADAHRIPPVYDQTGSYVLGDPVLYGEYEGIVVDWEVCRRIAAKVVDARVALLANHGVLVMAPDIKVAHHRAVTLEWRSRQAWRLEAMGGGVPMPVETTADISAVFDIAPFPHMWEAMVRRELRADPSILDE